MVALLIAASSAQAASDTFTCPELQAGLNQAAPGDVITLQGICTGQQFTLRNFGDLVAPFNYNSWTFTGDPSDGIDGFDGTGLTTAQRMLTGVDVHRLELQNLVFRDGDFNGNGGALDISGLSTLGLRNSSFFNNHATGKGGAVHFAPDSGPDNPTIGAIGVTGSVFGSEANAAEGNKAATGGALSIESPGTGNNNSGINGSTFANNTATGNGGGFAYAIPPATSENFSLNGNVVVKNTAGGSGGGGQVLGANSLLRVDNERYENNSVEPVAGYPAGDHFGGGLYLRGSVPIFRNNVFRGNAVKGFPVDGGNLGGGGLAVLGTDTNAQSEYSRIEGNTVAAPKAATQFESEGGGLFFSGDDGRWQGFLDAIAGNSVGDRGEGGGIYVGSAVGATSLELAEVTVAGNSVGAGGQFAGIAGDPQDDLVLWNSIVYSGGAGDIGGFDSFDIQLQRRMHVRRRSRSRAGRAWATSARTRSSSAAPTSTRRH